MRSSSQPCNEAAEDVRIGLNRAMTVAERTRWGIVSTGHIASVFARDLALLTDEAELAAVSSRTRAKAESFAAEAEEAPVPLYAAGEAKR